MAISGASGLVGRVLVEYFEGRGWRVLRLVRRHAQGAGEVSWDPVAGQLDVAALEGTDAVVHLAGENIASGRWTRSRKRRILDSRVRGTRLVAESLAAMAQPPAVLVSASAVGFYGDRGAERLTEEAQSGEGFLAEVCRRWEAATASAPEGTRVVHLRLGMVLAKEGGALDRMLPPFKMGVGGPLGSGQQYVSWITLRDLARAVEYLVDAEGVVGALNAVAPGPVTNREFVQTLGNVLGRPAVVPAPAFALRLALGEMADELLLSSARVFPKRLEEAGFVFEQTNIENALRAVLDHS